MSTPIYDYLKAYAAAHPMRLHMPGHKGTLALPELRAASALDLTEIPGADSLFEADGIIAASEAHTAVQYGAAASFYSCAGSTLCIQAMLLLMHQEGRQIVAMRSVHRAFLNACVLLDLSVHWVYPRRGSVLSGDYDPADFAAVLGRLDSPACVYLTSPDYLGHMADIPAFAAVCGQYGAKLVVDNAHGAHLAFLPDPCHPIALGADYCCDSAHKMLSGLTGTAYLHVGRKADADPARIRDAMAMFASTSPSYLLLASLDWCSQEMADPAWRRRLGDVALAAAGLRRRLGAKYCFPAGDPLHLTIDAWQSGFLGTELAAALTCLEIIPEYADAYHVVLLISAATTDEELSRLEQALAAFSPTTSPSPAPAPLPRPVPVASIRTAALAPQETCTPMESIGRICGASTVPCPPAVPIAAPGERIDKATAQAFLAYGVGRVCVVNAEFEMRNCGVAPAGSSPR